MLYIVAPFETENFDKKISSRNLELCRQEVGKSKIICSSFDHRYKKYNNMDMSRSFVKESLPSCDLIHIPTTPYKKNISIQRILSNFIFSISCAVYLLINARKNDKVLINSIPPEVLFFVSIVSLFKRFEIILDVRDIWPDALETRKSIIFSFFKLYCSFFYCFSAKKRVSKTYYVANSFKYWIDRNGFENESYFLPLGFDENRWNYRSLRNNSINLDKDKKTIVYIGYLSEQFDLSELINFVNTNDEWNLHVIGGGGKLDEYKTLAKPKKVTFHGMQPPHQIPIILEEVNPHIAALPLKPKAKAYMPNKLFDYIATSIPVLVKGSRDAGDFVRDNNFGWSLESEQSYSDILNDLDFKSILNCKRALLDNRAKYSMQNLYQSIGN